MAGVLVGGTAACNHYFADAAIDGQTITITGIGASEMACSPMQVMDAERAYLEALARVETFGRTGDRLVLRGPDSGLLYERLAPPPTAELVQTRWWRCSNASGRRSTGRGSR